MQMLKKNNNTTNNSNLSTVVLGEQLILYILKVGYWFIYPCMITSSTHPLYCPFRSMLD